MLLGGRAADLFGRRRVLVAGTVAVRAVLADRRPRRRRGRAGRRPAGAGRRRRDDAARRAVAPDDDVHRGHATATRRSASGAAWPAWPPPSACFLGGVLSEGPGWRWVLFVNPPVAVLLAGRRSSGCFPTTAAPGPRGGFDLRGAVLITGGMLLLVYALVKAPDVGWGDGAHDRRARRRRACCSPRSSSTSGAARNPLLPLSIFRINGLAAADVTQLIGVRRHHRDVLLPHPVHAERARLLADPDRRGLPAARASASGSPPASPPAARPRRHPAGDLRRRADRRGRRLLAVPRSPSTAPTSPTCCRG